MKINQIKEMSAEDLKISLKDNYEALQNFRFQLATGQLENYKSLSVTRKTIARIKTIIKERESKEKAS
ncbi:MAG: 50S ribosomal protein L29 [Bacteroidetes bacterium]|nr:50S ribosomal protein L29 [Bacteroidota bacterium]